MTERAFDPDLLEMLPLLPTVTDFSDAPRFVLCANRLVCSLTSLNLEMT